MLNQGMRQRRSMATDEAEALQTDVMRFLAIICMCLMIVFSLVQSLPVTETENQPKMVSKQMLEMEIKGLEEKAEQLNRVLDALEDKIVQKQQDLEQNKAKMEKSREMAEKISDITRKKVEELKQKQNLIEAARALVRSAKQKEKEAKAKTDQIRSELERKKSDLEKTARLVTKGRQELKGVEKDIRAAKDKIKKIENLPPTPRVETKKAETRRKKEIKRQEQTPRKDPVKKKEQAQQQSSGSEEKEGFFLGFESNDALMQLLRRNRQVELYILTGNKSWKLQVNASMQLRFLSSPAPDKIYEMDRRTVPEIIIRASRKTVAAFGKGAVTYGVTLPADITRQLYMLMKGKKGGDLIISETGQVSLI